MSVAAWGVGARGVECATHLPANWSSKWLVAAALLPPPQAVLWGARTGLVGWPINTPWVGQSFVTERLGMTLTSRLRTPPDRPSHHARPRALSFFFHPGSPGASFASRFPDTARQSQKEGRALRDS